MSMKKSSPPQGLAIVNHLSFFSFWIACVLPYSQDETWFLSFDHISMWIA